VIPFVPWGELAFTVILKLLDVFLAEDQGAVLLVDDEERPHDATGVREDLELSLTDVVDERYLGVDPASPTKLMNKYHEVLDLVRDADPGAVDEYLGGALHI